MIRSFFFNKPLCFLVTVIAVLGWISSLAFAKRHPVSGSRLYETAKAIADKVDHGCYPVYVRYSGGTPDGKFSCGKFIFFSPVRKKSGKVPSCIVIRIPEYGKPEIYYSSYSSADLSGLEYLPDKIFEKILAGRAGAWWEKHKAAQASLALGPVEYMGRVPGFGDRSNPSAMGPVWKFELQGPGLSEYFKAYFRAKDMTLLGQKIVPVPKEYRNISTDDALKQIQDILKKHK